MCVIVYKNSKTDLPESVIKQCWLRNGHGAGFVARKNIQEPWLMKKGIMKLDDLLKEVAPFIGQDGEIILHLRIMSKGEVTPELTHPFDYGFENFGRWFFHNGTIKFINNPKGHSDSSFFAEKILKNIHNDGTIHEILNANSFVSGRFVTAVDYCDVGIHGDNESKWQSYMGSTGDLWFSNTRHESFKNGDLAPTIGDGACGYTGDDDYWGHFINRKNKHFSKYNTPGVRFTLERELAEKMLRLRHPGSAGIELTLNSIDRAIEEECINNLNIADLENLAKANYTLYEQYEAQISIIIGSYS